MLIDVAFGDWLNAAIFNGVWLIAPLTGSASLVQPRYKCRKDKLNEKRLVGSHLKGGAGQRSLESSCPCHSQLKAM